MSRELIYFDMTIYKYEIYLPIEKKPKSNKIFVDSIDLQND